MEHVGAWSITLFSVAIRVHEDRTIFSIDSCESVDKYEGETNDNREDKQDEDNPDCRIRTGSHLGEA